MRVGIPKYQDLDFSREVWKTLSAIKIIQSRYKKSQVSKNFLTAILLLDTEQPFGKPEPLTTQKIHAVENEISDHLEILLKNNLITIENNIAIPSEHDDLLAHLTNHVYLNIHLPLDSYHFYERIIPHSASTKGGYTDYDDSFTSLSRGMYIPRGFFLKTWIEENVFSGIMEVTDNFEKIHEYLQSIRKELREAGINISVLEPIPIQPIPLFPLFTEAGRLKQHVEKKTPIDTKISADNAKEVLEQWYEDFIVAHYEISKQVPRIDLADSFWDKPKHYLVMTNTKLDTILTAEYLSENKDRVEVRIVDKVPMIETLHDEVKDLPSRHNLLRTSVSWRKNIISTLQPPFYAAMKEIAERIKEFNKNAHSHMFDANDVTEDEIKDWLKAELYTKRYLIERLQIKDENALRWIKPISIVAEYSLDDPKPSWRRSGNLFIKYTLSDKDSIQVRKLEKEEYEETKTSRRKEPDDKDFMWSSGDLLHRMMENRGEYATVSL